MLELRISQKDVEYPGNDERTKHIGRNCQTKLPNVRHHNVKAGGLAWRNSRASTGVHVFFWGFPKMGTLSKMDGL